MKLLASKTHVSFARQSIMAKKIPPHHKELERLLKQRKSLPSIQRVMREKFGVHFTLQQLEQRFNKLHKTNKTPQSKIHSISKNAQNAVLLHIRSGRKCCTYSEIQQHIQTSLNVKLTKAQIIGYVKQEADIATDSHKVHFHKGHTNQTNALPENPLTLEFIQSHILEATAKFSHPQVSLFSDHLLRSFSKLERLKP